MMLANDAQARSIRPGQRIQIMGHFLCDHPRTGCLRGQTGLVVAGSVTTTTVLWDDDPIPVEYAKLSLGDTVTLGEDGVEDSSAKGVQRVDKSPRGAQTTQ